MECQVCKAANPESNRFCENCGEGLTCKCGRCGFDCSPTSKFCGGCGAPLDSSSAVHAAAKPAPAINAATYGWAELKQATVLFADIVSSTEQIAALSPEEAMGRLQPAILTMCSAVERFGGTVIRTLGDGVMALFGVPNALEGHATLACEAALQMRRAFVGDSKGLNIRVGLHSGQVASDPDAADGTKGGGAHGLTIHLASRVVAVAPPGQITLTADCYALVRRGGVVQSLGFPSLKGIPGSIEILVLESLNPESGHRQFNEGKLTPLRGRDREMALLQGCQARAEQGAGNVIGITGPPGTGKSRLCFEFAQWSRRRNIPVFEVHAQLYGHATPLQPALELLRVFFFRIPAAVDAAAARLIVSSRLAGVGPLDEADVRLVHDFLGIGAQAAAVQLNPRARRARLLHIVRDLFEQLSGTHAILVIEDLHWLDEASEEFVSVLINAVAGTRVLLVLNYRGSYLAPWLNLPHFQQMALAELTTGDTAALVRELVSSRREFSELYELIAKRSGGNPFFAEELVQTLAESGALGDASASRQEAVSIDKALPSTVQAVISARIDRLGEAEKGLLQTCAIVGKEIPLGVLVQVTLLPMDILRSLLDRLFQAQLIQPAEGWRHLSFRHPLIQEVAYATQLKVRRSSIHSAVAKSMVVFYADRLDEYSALIAYHFAAAGNNMQAAVYESRAAQWVGAMDSTEAVKHWHKVRALLETEPGGPESNHLKVLASSKITWLGWRDGLDFEQVKPFIDEAMALANNDPRWTQLLLMVEGRILQACGASADLYVERVEKAISLVDRQTQAGRAVTLNAALSQAYGWAGLLYEALAANDAALAQIEHIDKFDHEFVGFSIEQWVLAMRGRLLTRLGRFDEAARCLDQLIAVGASSVDPVIVMMPHYGYVELASHTGDVNLAQEHLTRMQEVVDRHQSPYLRVFALNGQALLHAMKSDYENAARVLGESLVLVRNAKVAMEFETEVLANLAESHRCAQNMELALALSKEAARLASERGNRLPECRSIMTWAGILAADPRLGQPGEAGALLDRASTLIRTTGARSYENGLVPTPAAGLLKGISLASAA